MFNRIHQHLHVNGILVPEQCGFRRGINIQNTNFPLTNTILSSLNKKQVIAGFYCDIYKVFDILNHSVLLQIYLTMGSEEFNLTGLNLT